MHTRSTSIAICKGEDKNILWWNPCWPRSSVSVSLLAATVEARLCWSALCRENDDVHKMADTHHCFSSDVNHDDHMLFKGDL